MKESYQNKASFSSNSYVYDQDSTGAEIESLFAEVISVKGSGWSQSLLEFPLVVIYFK